MKIKFCIIFPFFLLFSAYAQTIPNLPLPLGAGTAEVWNSNIYFIGGSNNWSGSVVYPRIYQFDGNIWAYHDSIPDNNLWDVESVLVQDSLYLISGWPGGATSLRKYDMKNGNWQNLASSPNSQTWGVTAEYYQGNIYLFNSEGFTFQYEIATDQWFTKTSNNNTGTWDLSSILFEDEIYIIGFSDSTFYKYSPNSDQWTELNKTPYPVGACAMGIINNLIYCIGGNIDGSSTAYYRSVIVYDILTNSWAIDSLEISSRRHWMATAEYKGGLYVVGGIDSNAVSVNTVEEIIPQGTSNLHTPEYQPVSFKLQQNYPNPFNSETNIHFSISTPEHVSVTIYNILGEKIETLLSETMTPGAYTIRWNAQHLPSGVYYYRFIFGSFNKTRKMILLE